MKTIRGFYGNLGDTEPTKSMKKLTFRYLKDEEVLIKVLTNAALSLPIEF